jgi:hypothetical protein
MELAMASSDLRFVNVPVVQSKVSDKLGTVLGDIESRMPKGHQYSDKDLVTWAHETTHGLNNRVRNKLHEPGKFYNAFYVLDGQALVLPEPKFLISDAADSVPSHLRGDIYDLYMVKQQASWNDRPLYIWDEWNGYQNGSATRTDLDINERFGTVEYMWEMAVYSTYIAMHKPDDAINNALLYMMNRTSILYYSSKNTVDADEYISKIKSTKELMDYLNSVGFGFLSNI